MAAVLKICESMGLVTSDNVVQDMAYEKDGNTYLKLIEAFKFAYAQRTKFGDPLDNEDAEQIVQV